MTSLEIRKKFLDFFAKRGHTVVPSSSLIPYDPSVLLTTAGMQQFKPYYTGDADPLETIHPTLGKPLGSKNAVSVQKSFRTSDIDEVGDATHLTFFEMLGNFSFDYKPGLARAGTAEGDPISYKGGYFKEKAIAYAHEFITGEMGLKISYVTIFEGDQKIGVPKDEDSKKIWSQLGVAKIIEQGMEDVFWGPTGSAGPCGPTTEIYCINAAGEDVEIWNIVFNEFYYPGSREELLSGASDKKLERLKAPGVDTGMGLERLVMIAQNTKNIFETDLFTPFLLLVPENVPERERRIITDHLRGVAFLLADGVRPSNKEAGYILRRLMRRVLAYEKLYTFEQHIIDALLHDIAHEYGQFYPEVMKAADVIREEWSHERERFATSLERGMKALATTRAKGAIDAKIAFTIYQSFGMPFEIIKDLGGEAARSLSYDAFSEEFKKHQEISRAGIEKKFGGHGLLLDTGELKARDEKELEKVTRFHTATHLLQAALRKVLGSEVQQMGSDISVERTRFDFSFSRKLMPDEVRAVEKAVNNAIERDLQQKKEEMPYEEAVQAGALHFFKEKYPDRVSVYSFIDKDGSVFSRELCGGPHVTHTKTIGKFTILKEEASSAGVRRIRASIEP